MIIERKGSEDLAKSSASVEDQSYLGQAPRTDSCPWEDMYRLNSGLRRRYQFAKQLARIYNPVTMAQGMRLVLVYKDGATLFGQWRLWCVEHV